MRPIPYKTALIVGAGPGISASVARAFVAEGIQIGLSSRNVDKLADLASEIDAHRFAADATDPASVADLFDEAEAAMGQIDIVLYNAVARVAGPLVELDVVEVERVIRTSTFAAFLVVQQAAQRMVPRKSGAILLTGASASVKGYARSAPFAMGMFGRRGLAESAARELHPQGVHVAHFVIDGAVRGSYEEDPQKPDSLIDPDAIAQSYVDVLRQPRNAWSWEIALRPWTESF